MKTCSRCGLRLPLERFYKTRKNSKYYRPECKDCTKQANKESARRQREKMGEEAFLARQREIVRRSRKNRGTASEKAYNAAYRGAVRELIEEHEEEFREILARHRRGTDDASG